MRKSRGDIVAELVVAIIVFWSREKFFFERYAVYVILYPHIQDELVEIFCPRRRQVLFCLFGYRLDERKRNPMRQSGPLIRF